MVFRQRYNGFTSNLEITNESAIDSFGSYIYVRLHVQYGTFVKVYQSRELLREGEHYSRYIRSVFNTANSYSSTQEFIRELELHEQRREGYYTAMGNRSIGESYIR